MNKQDFCTFQQSKDLKGLGFNEPCLYRWSEEKYFACNASVSATNYNLTELGYISVPSISQALRFFREKFGLYTSIDYLYAPIFGIKIYTPYEQEPLFAEWGFATYEEAENALIDKLIEVARGKIFNPKS